MKELEEATISTQREEYAKQFSTMGNTALIALGLSVQDIYVERTELKELTYALAQRLKQQDD